MKEWTRAESYRALTDPEELRAPHARVRQSRYRQTYHVQPVTGLLNDPNGFARHGGAWQLCYQWCPWGAVHGLKYWYRVASSDLVHWHNAGIALAPDRDFDNRGVYSGSAIGDGEDLVYFYTGNHRDEDWTRTAYTCAAVLRADGRVEKPDAPLFGPHPDYSEHQRDPKIVYRPEDRAYYILIGARTRDDRGRVLVYRSDLPRSGWRFAGELNVPGLESFGSMWECPCLARVDGKDVLIFCPQDVRLPGRAENTNHNVYLIGRMDFGTLTFTPEGECRPLDYGFDFYAAQTAAGAEDPDPAVLIGWIGLPGAHYPTDDEDWVGSLTLPRALRVRDGRLLQTPIPAMYALRGPQQPDDGTLPAACEMEVDAPEGDFALNLFTRDDGSGGLRLQWRGDRRALRVDKRAMDLRFNAELGETLEMPLESPPRKLDIFIDHSSIEIFANDGEAVFTAHVYPTARERRYQAGAGVRIRLWPLRGAVEDDFVI